MSGSRSGWRHASGSSTRALPRGSARGRPLRTGSRGRRPAESWRSKRAPVSRRSLGQRDERILDREEPGDVAAHRLVHLGGDGPEPLVPFLPAPGQHRRLGEADASGRKHRLRDSGEPGVVERDLLQPRVVWWSGRQRRAPVVVPEPAEAGGLLSPDYDPAFNLWAMALATSLVPTAVGSSREGFMS